MSRVLTALILLLAVTAAACGGGAGAEEGGVRVLEPADAAAVIDAEPDRVIIDIRTPEEFASGHLEGAELIDFYQPDFADRVAALDRDTAYVIYCRSGNRSGQARALFDELGFADVVDIGGGIAAWQQAGLPLVA